MSYTGPKKLKPNVSNSNNQSYFHFKVKTSTMQQWTPGITINKSDQSKVKNPAK